MLSSKKNWIKEYFTFSKKERRAVFVLLFFAVFFALLPAMFPFLVKDDVSIEVDTATERQLAQLKIPNKYDRINEKDFVEQYDQPKYPPYKKFEKTEIIGELFYFNPNTASSDDWKKLGLREKTIQTILNYRSKGGKFRKPEDLQHIYGLRKEEYERLVPYANIEPLETANKESVTGTFSFEKKYESKESKIIFIDINNADTTEWKKLNGIGSKLSQRIINFRTKLGGFVSVEQVGETFGLPDSTFQKIKSQLQVKQSTVVKINLNEATLDVLKSHPYLKYAVANAIIQYRNEHGPFKTVSELQKLGAIDESLYTKIAPYLTVEEGGK
jgi:competence protein ComEA